MFSIKRQISLQDVVVKFKSSSKNISILVIISQNSTAGSLNFCNEEIWLTFIRISIQMGLSTKRECHYGNVIVAVGKILQLKSRSVSMQFRMQVIYLFHDAVVNNFLESLDGFML